MIEMPRLVLRNWRAADAAPYAAMMADPEVGYWLGGVRSETECLAQIARIETAIAARGYGFFAVERRDDGAFLGFCGLDPVDHEGPLKGATEIGWRLARHAWGAGYASEAAAGALADGFGRLGFAEIFAFTAIGNARSRDVMRRLGMVRRAELDFSHPRLAPTDPLRPHVVYSLAAPIPGASGAR